MKVTTKIMKRWKSYMSLYEQKIYYVAYSILNNIQQAEDTVQETFITLYKNLEKLHSLSTEA